MLLQAPASLGHGIITLAYFLVPGYVSYKIYLQTSHQEDDFERFDKLLYTAMFGLLSIFLISILFRSNISVWYASEGIPTWKWTIFFERELLLEELGQTSIAQFCVMITFQTSIGSLLAYSIGKYHVSEDRSAFDIQQPWDTAMEGIDKGSLLRVRTTNGDEIAGELHQSGSKDGNYNLLLRKPRIKSQNDNDWVPAHEDADTDIMYHNHEDISRVHFIDYHLPDKRPEDSTDESDTDSTDSPDDSTTVESPEPTGETTEEPQSVPEFDLVDEDSPHENSDQE